METTETARTNDTAAGGEPAPTPATRGGTEIPLYKPGLPLIGASRAVKRDPFRFYLDAYRRNGPVYRLPLAGRTPIVLGGLEANDFIWRNPENWSYAQTNVALREQMGPDHVTQLDGKRHRARRQHLQPAFRPDTIMRQVPKMDGIIAASLAAHAGQPTDFTRLLARTIIKMSSQTVVQCQLSDATIETMDRWEYEFIYGISLRWMRHFYYNRPGYRRRKREVFAEFGRILDARLAMAEPPEDNLTAILRAHEANGGEPPSRWDLLNDIYLVLLAGAHNTTNLIYWCLLYLQTHPEWRAALREELQPYDGTSFRGLAQFPRLKATIQEVQRLRPGSIFLNKTAAVEMEFQGYRIAAGSPVIHTNSLCHFLDEIYEDPFSFRPERYLEGKTYPPKANGFFGGGSHICLGMNMTLIHTPLFLANIVRNYDLSLDFDPNFDVRLSFGSNQMRANVPGKLIPRPQTAAAAAV
jgi:cytochrome P450